MLINFLEHLFRMESWFLRYKRDSLSSDLGVSRSILIASKEDKDIFKIFFSFTNTKITKY